MRSREMSVTLITFNNPCQGLLQGLQHNWLVWFTFFFLAETFGKKGLPNQNSGLKID